MKEQILITARVNIYQTKESISIVMKASFYVGKLMKQFGKPHLSKRTPPLSTNPLSLSNFFMTPLFVEILKTKLPLILGGWEETMVTKINFSLTIITNNISLPSLLPPSASSSSSSSLPYVPPRGKSRILGQSALSRT